MRPKISFPLDIANGRTTFHFSLAKKPFSITFLPVQNAKEKEEKQKMAGQKVVRRRTLPRCEALAFGGLLACSTALPPSTLAAIADTTVPGRRTATLAGMCEAEQNYAVQSRRLTMKERP